MDIDTSDIIILVSLFILILMSAYFSATEMAFSSLNKLRVKAMAEDGNKRAKKVLKLLDDFDRLISAILVGNNIVNILSTSLATLFFVKLFTEMGGNGDFGVTVSTIVMTILVLIFGEVCPKGIAKEKPEKFALFSAPFISIVLKVFTPAIVVLVFCKKIVLKLFVRADEEKDTITEDELIDFVEEAEHEGSIDEQESELIRSAIEFGEIDAGGIATPRVDIVAVERGSTKEAIAQVFNESGFSRLPVYEETLDNIVGTIHYKDFFTKVYRHKVTVESIMKKPVFVTGYMKVQDLLRKLQSSKAHIAVVVDEYGGSAGIITMEDILEELVGEIWDEHDEVIEDITPLSNGSYRVLCSVEFEKFIEYFDLDTVDDYTSVSGWVADRLGKIAETGDCFESDGLSVRVADTIQRRVTRIVVTPIHKELEQEDEE